VSCVALPGFRVEEAAPSGRACREQTARAPV